MTDNLCWEKVPGLLLYLQTSWLEGRSTAGIAFDINAKFGHYLAKTMTKNAVVGKVHRLDMIARPSPIRTAKVYALPKAAVFCPALPPTSHTLPPLTSEVMPPVPSYALVTAKAEHHARRRMLQMRRVKKEVEILAQPPPVRTHRECPKCCWPIGNPGTPSFHFCDDPSVSVGSPYCNEHHRLAHMRVRIRDEDHA